MVPVFGDVFTEMALASTPYREAIGACLVGLRDFLLLFFFIDLGVGLDLATLGTQVIPTILFSLFLILMREKRLLTVYLTQIKRRNKYERIKYNTCCN